VKIKKIVLIFLGAVSGAFGAKKVESISSDLGEIEVVATKVKKKNLNQWLKKNKHQVKAYPCCLN